MITGVLEHCDDRLMEYCDGKGKEHCDEKTMEPFVDMSHGTL